jgi:hypothetical protein
MDDHQRDALSVWNRGNVEALRLHSNFRGHRSDLLRSDNFSRQATSRYLYDPTKRIHVDSAEWLTHKPFGCVVPPVHATASEMQVRITSPLPCAVAVPRQPRPVRHSTEPYQDCQQEAPRRRYDVKLLSKMRTGQRSRWGRPVASCTPVAKSQTLPLIEAAMDALTLTASATKDNTMTTSPSWRDNYVGCMLNSCSVAGSSCQASRSYTPSLRGACTSTDAPSSWMRRCLLASPCRLSVPDSPAGYWCEEPLRQVSGSSQPSLWLLICTPSHIILHR